MLACTNNFIFSEQEIESFEDDKDGGDEEDVKPYIQFTETSVHNSGDKYFLICGDSVVFVLNDENDYSKKLTKEEIEALDFSIVWNGPKQKVQYEADDEKAVESIIKIITNVNQMETEDFYGFPLASIVSHLRAFLYLDILKEQHGFYTTITVSGEQRGTG